MIGTHVSEIGWRSVFISSAAVYLIIFAYVGPDRCIASCRTLGSPRSLEFFKVVSLAGIDSSAPQKEARTPFLISCFYLAMSWSRGDGR